jgi:hypothetical protein
MADKIARNGRKLKEASATATTALQENASASLLRYLFNNSKDIDSMTTLVGRFASAKKVTKHFSGKGGLSVNELKNFKALKKGSANYLRAMMGLGPQPKDGKFSQGITKYPNNTKDVRAIIFNEFPEEYMKDDGWLETFYLQMNKLMTAKISPSAKGVGTIIKSSDYTEFDRDAKNGFMDYIEKEIKKYNISKKDTWNPADIWILKKTGEKYVRSAISALSDSNLNLHIDKLNAVMKRLMKEHALIGISLKKISGGSASWKVYNLAANVKFYGSGMPVYEASYSDSVDMPLNIKDFESGADEKEPWKRRLYDLGDQHSKKFQAYAEEVFSASVAKQMGGKPQAWGRMDMTVRVKENNKQWAKLEIKSNSSSSDSGQNLKFEPVQIAAAAARMGKAEGNEVGKLFKALGIPEGPTFNQWQAYPRSLAQWNQEKSKYKRLVASLNGWKCWKQSGDVSADMFVKNITYLFHEVQLLMKYDISFEEIKRSGKKPLKPDHAEVMKRVKKMAKKGGSAEKYHGFHKQTKLEIYKGETELKKVKGQLVGKPVKEEVKFDGTGYKYALVKKVVPASVKTMHGPWQEGEDEWVLAEIYEAPNWGSDYTNAKFISNRLRFNITSKLMIVKVATMLMRLYNMPSIYHNVPGDKHTQLDVFVTECIMLAQKHGQQFGPFGKLY